MEVKWREWNDKNLLDAQSQNKPILLSISATWCHWCHRMDHDTYDIQEIAKKINSDFIPIRIDTDRRPDINDRYNMGGWPTTAILTPTGDLIAGATYIPPNQMKQFLHDVKKEYDMKGESIQKYTTNEHGKKSSDEINGDLIRQFEEMVEYYFDPAYAGFGNSMKFPQPDLLSFLCTLSECGNVKALGMLEATLDSMGNRGLYDTEEGGFFRYCTQQNWEVPHYEKMVEDNLKIIDVYMRVFQITKNDWYKQKAEHALKYTMNNLFDSKAGLFYGSQDADEEYYKLKLDKRRQKDPPFIDKTFYVNWNCFGIVTLLHASKVLGLGYKEVALNALEKIIQSYKSDGMKHFIAEKYDGPTLLSDYAALLDAVLEAYKFTLDNKHRDFAITLYEEIKKIFKDTDGVLFDLPKSNGSGPLSKRLKKLPENASVAMSLIRLSQMAEKPEYMEDCKAILESFVNESKKGDLYSATYSEAVYIYLEGLSEITIFGSLESEDIKEIIEANYQITRRISVNLKEPEENAPLATICKNNTCKSAKTPQEFKVLLASA